MTPRVVVSIGLGISLLLMIAGTLGPWGDIVLDRTVDGWDTSGGPVTLVAALILGASAVPAALFPRSPKPLRVPMLAIGIFVGVLMAALAVYWAVSIEDLVSSTSGVEGAGWGVYLTAAGSVCALIDLIALTVVTVRST
jgi:preprotein translocase subunit Sec61beta